MAQAEEVSSPFSDDLECFSTEELLRWAQEMEYFGSESFVWDTCAGLDSDSAIRAENGRTQKGPDELLANLSRNEGAPLCGDRRRSGRRTQNC